MKLTIRKKLRLLGMIGLPLIVLAACGGGGGGDVTPAAFSGTVTLTVLDSATGQPIQGATVQSGGVSSTTAASGASTLINLPQGTSQVSVAKAGYATNFRRVSVVNNGTYRLNVQLLPVITTAIDPTVANIVVGGGAQVSLSANSLTDAAGNAPVGPVSASVAAIDPSSSFQLMPGSMTNVAGAPIQSYGAMTATFTDSNGAALNLSAGQTATVTIPVAIAARAAAPATTPLFFFDTATNTWAQQGTATLNGAGTAYVGTVTHFSYWNADQTYTTSTVSGCVNDANGNPLAGAEIKALGNSYVGLSEATTDAAGNFTVSVMANGTTLVSGENHYSFPITFTNTVTAVAGAAGGNTAIAVCLVMGSPVATSNIQLKLTWGQNPSDLDSHLTGPDAAAGRFHVYYRQKNYPLGALPASAEVNLDVDDVTSFGPEFITVRTLRPGTYKYSVHHFAGAGNTRTSPTRVELLINGNLTIYTPPATGWAGVGDVWQVLTLTVNQAGNIAVTPINTVVNGVGSTGVVYGAAVQAKPVFTNWPW